MLIVILALIVLIPAAIACFMIDAHLNNVSTIQLNKRQAERDQMAADARTQSHYYQ